MLQNKLLLTQDSGGRKVWYYAAEKGSLELIDKLWVWAKGELSSLHLLKNKIFLSRNANGVNASHLTAMRGNVEILDKLWGWAKELQLKPEV